MAQYMVYQYMFPKLLKRICILMLREVVYKCQLDRSMEVQKRKRTPLAGGIKEILFK